MKNINFATLTQNECPIFLFASGHRCGSTLLQRILNSNPDFMIWGEQNGALNPFLDSYRNLREWEKRVASSRKTFLLEGYDNFIANMVPEDYEIRDAAIAYLSTLFGVPAIKQDRNIWGFKEVRYGVQMAQFLQECFPNARFIHLTRNVQNCLLSMKKWEVDENNAWIRPWTIQSLKNWKRINKSFIDYAHLIQNYWFVKYEDMVEEPDKFLDNLASFLEVDVLSFDQKVFQRKLTSTGKEETREIKRIELTAEDQALVLTPEFKELTRQLGYA